MTAGLDAHTSSWVSSYPCKSQPRQALRAAAEALAELKPTLAPESGAMPDRASEARTHAGAVDLAGCSAPGLELVGASSALVAVAATTGVLAGVVQFLGLIRWPFLVPYLARADADPNISPARREAIDLVFQSFHRYLGVAVGEHLGYLFTGGWTALTGVALIQATNTPGWLGVAGIVIGVLLMMCSLEFVGSFEQEGWKVAATATPIAYIAWSVWLIAIGVTLLL